MWSLCPVAIPVSDTSFFSSPTLTSIPLSTKASLSLSQETTDLVARQDAGSSTISDSSSTSNLGSTYSLSSSTLTMSGENMLATSFESHLPAISAVPDSSQPLYNIGPYSCTATVNSYMLISLLLDYIQKTQNTIDAHLLIITLNIHAAKSNTNIDGPATQPLIYPNALNSLGSLFSANLSAYIYTPGDLRSNRANLNTSWYSVTERYRPVLEYYTTATQEFGVRTTEDGWPSEAYIEFSQGKRLLLQTGAVDPQMKNYNFDGDANTIFAPGYINNPRESDILASSEGPLTSGCFLVNATEQIFQVNSSWATSANLPGFDYPTTSDSNITSLLNLTSSLTACGISPTLNTTLLNTTASTHNPPYKNFTQSTLWSWAPNEPRPFSSSTDNSDSLFRCATLRTQTNHWHATDCSTKLYAACRAPSQPYNWTLTTYTISYSYAPQACPSPYIFAAPRTPLENAYLSQTLLNQSPTRDFDNEDPKIWLDFNSLETKNCWTMGGPNATCPYNGQQAIIDDITKKEILVPTVAALIVLILTGGVVFGKCAGRGWMGWRSGGKRRRKADGVVYEGVPA